MNHVEKILRILVILTLCLSGLLLGMSQGDFGPLLIAVISAVTAWLLVDTLKWFSLPQWLANGIAIVVTAVTVASFFFTGDPVRQLLGVGKLLVYLQSVLLFQRKSARVYWQILVLGLLQIVVGAVFNVGFEGGVLFIGYVMCAGMTMLVLHLYHQREQAGVASRLARRRRDARPQIALVPQFDSRPNVLRRMMSHYLAMGLGVLVFGAAWFWFLPREDSSWSGPVEVPMRPTGYLQQVSSAHPELIPMSTQIVMTVKYRRPGALAPMWTEEMPYLRGIALAGLSTDANSTTWVPASSQVLNADFHSIPRSRGGDQTMLVQEMVLEPTDNPLLYSQYPLVAIGDEQDEFIEHCWPLGCITRERAGEKIQVAHYRYNLGVITRADGTFLEAWPYESRTGRNALTAEDDPGVHRWLTYLEKERYPEIVRVAGEIAARSTDNHLRFARECRDWFSPANRYAYTVDFRNVTRNRSIDGVEDFFANHRTGHCTYYASALALMLRSQGVPARVVTGYRGGTWNEFGSQLDVEARHAHAWVEAYIRPADCPGAWQQSGEAGPIGAWVMLDATPPVDYDQFATSRALNYAKSFWRDYVLGLQAEQGATTITADGFQLAGLLRMLDLAWWRDSAVSTVTRIRQPGLPRTLTLVAGTIIACGIGFAVWRVRRVRRNGRTMRSKSLLASNDRSWRGRLARLARGISPALARWLEPQFARRVTVPFYERMVLLLEQAGWVRSQQQTQREFAAALGQPDTGSDGPELASLTTRITEFYYLVRFGGHPLDDRQQTQVEESLAQLEQRLAARAVTATTATRS